jgi:hypothetical protein
MKKCFSCKLTLPLFCFSKNKRTFQLKSDKGRNIVCLRCNYNYIKQDMFCWYFSNSLGKFVRKEFKSKLDIIEHLIKTYNGGNR